MMRAPLVYYTDDKEPQHVTNHGYFWHVQPIAVGEIWLPWAWPAPSLFSVVLATKTGRGPAPEIIGTLPRRCCTGAFEFWQCFICNSERSQGLNFESLNPKLPQPPKPLFGYLFVQWRPSGVGSSTSVTHDRILHRMKKPWTHYKK